MKIINNSFNSDIITDFLPNDFLFFDIETTGFSKTGCFCYLIGVCFADKNIPKKFNTIQWLADNINDEPLIIKEFLEFCTDFKTIIHFNGDNFDIPFIEKRASIHNISFNSNNFNNIDLYKCAKKLKPLLRLASYNQKSIENFIGIYRTDEYSGGELINVYKEYSKTQKEDLKHLLLLHNYDDICGLVSIFSICNYNNIIEENITFKNAEYEEDNITLAFNIPYTVPAPILLTDSCYAMRIDKCSLKLRFPIVTDTLKYFYEDYKNYYYLPYEDTAIHKSVASYVDAECRVKATKKTCYTKKYATFIKLPNFDITETALKRDFDDSDAYIVYDNKNALPENIIALAAHALITFFCRKTTR